MHNLNSLNTSLAEALKRANINPNELPEYLPSAPFIESKEIPEALKLKIKNTLQKCIAHKIPMPFIHITLEKILKNDGQAVPTGFVEKIVTEGSKVNTNGATFVQRSPDKNTTIAEPAYFVEHPEAFIENLALMVQRYTHHGTRTNKKSLGRGYGYKSNVQTEVGIPIMMVIDRGTTPLKRGKDGDDHYVTLERVPAREVVGSIALENVNPTDKISVLELTDGFLTILDEYLEKKTTKLQSN